MIQIDHDNNSLILTFSRPEKKNALTSDMYRQLATSLRDAIPNDDIRSIIVTGAGDCFTAGNDIGDFLASGGQMDETSPVIMFLRALHDCSKPLVMAVDGLAIGIGTTMLLHADFAYASHRATFKLPFVDLSLVPEAASSLLLPARLGLHAANRMLMLGETFSADEAHAHGLIERVDAPMTALDKAKETASRLNEKSPEALRATKALIRAPLKDSVSTQLDQEFVAFSERLKSPELKAAAMKFLSRKA